MNKYIILVLIIFILILSYKSKLQEHYVNYNFNKPIINISGCYEMENVGKFKISQNNHHIWSILSGYFGEGHVYGDDILNNKIVWTWFSSKSFGGRYVGTFTRKGIEISSDLIWKKSNNCLNEQKNISGIYILKDKSELFLHQDESNIYTKYMNRYLGYGKINGVHIMWFWYFGTPWQGYYNGKVFDNLIKFDNGNVWEKKIIPSFNNIPIIKNKNKINAISDSKRIFWKNTQYPLNYDKKKDKFFNKNLNDFKITNDPYPSPKVKVKDILDKATNLKYFPAYGDSIINKIVGNGRNAIGFEIDNNIYKDVIGSDLVSGTYINIEDNSGNLHKMCKFTPCNKQWDTCLIRPGLTKYNKNKRYVIKSIDNDCSINSNKLNITTTSNNDGSISCNKYCKEGTNNEAPINSKCIRAQIIENNQDISCNSINNGNIYCYCQKLPQPNDKIDKIRKVRYNVSNLVKDDQVNIGYINPQYYLSNAKSSESSGNYKKFCKEKEFWNFSNANTKVIGKKNEFLCSIACNKDKNCDAYTLDPKNYNCLLHKFNDPNISTYQCDIPFPSGETYGKIKLSNSDPVKKRNPPKCNMNIIDYCKKNQYLPDKKWFSDNKYGGPEPSDFDNCLKRKNHWINYCGNKNINMKFTNSNGDIQTSSYLKPIPTNTLNSGDLLFPEDFLISNNLEYKLVFQTDGNLCISHNGNNIWCLGDSEYNSLITSKTSENCVLVLQDNGNLCIYSPKLKKNIWSMGDLYWKKQLNDKSASNNKMILKNDGNLVVYSESNIILWQRLGNRDKNVSFLLNSNKPLPSNQVKLLINTNKYPNNQSSIM